MQVQWGSASDAGGRRKMNEDAAFARHPVFVVADGMGGHARGEMASRTVVAAFGALADQEGPITPADVTDAVRAGAEQIRQTMEEEARQGGLGPDLADAMAGTTVAGVVLTHSDGEPYWLVLNVGDSRVYRFSRDRLEQVSVDHSLVQELVDAGELAPAEARTHPRRNVITRAVGTGLDVEVDYWMLHVGADDRLLVCTDGLFGELGEDEIADVLRTRMHPTAAAEELIERAVADGGARDNITAVVVDVDNEDAVGTTATGSGHGRAEVVPPESDAEVAARPERTFATTAPSPDAPLSTPTPVPATPLAPTPTTAES
ncbi:PP2C family protein-serine/threonine phosphatase [Georgenia sp. Z1344]|uniref:PP2C family protein-serine/threonine phosphatase n=1 Tax=Georgenia sp. Z1344 TaxID=3416706 RepID=UPI003CEEFB3E